MSMHIGYQSDVSVTGYELKHDEKCISIIVLFIKNQIEHSFPVLLFA